MEKEKKIGDTLLRVVEGDITTYSVDALVNAANNHLWMGGGVAGAIKRKGGKVIEEEAVKQGPIPVGHAVATGAGKLPAKYVIHAAVMGQDLKTDAEKIRLATSSSLELCRQLKVESVAFPALGTGVGGFPLAEAANIMLGEVAAFCRSYSGLKLVVFALYGQEAFQAFDLELEQASHV